MSEINTLLELLTEQEQTGFINLMKKKNKRKDTKNITLFKDFQKNEPRNLKASLGDNAYNVLKKRLTDSLTSYTAGTLIQREKSAEVGIMKRIVLGRKLFDHKAYKAAFKQMTLAQKEAEHISHFHLLNEIYQTLIAHSYHPHAPEQEELFLAYEANKMAYLNQSNLTMAYAVIRKSFQAQERFQTEVDLESIIRTNFEKFGIHESEAYNFQSLYQLAEMTDIVGASLKNYYKVDLFFEQKIKLIEDGPLDTEQDLIHHIDLLYLIAHIYFRKKDFVKSRVYLKKMHHQMSRFQGVYMHLRLGKHKLLMAMNLNFTGNHRDAASILDEILHPSVIKSISKRNRMQAAIARIMICIQQKELSLAKQLMATLKQSDAWYAKYMGLEWLLNKKFIEIILHIELGNTDFVDSRIASLTRKGETLFIGANRVAFAFLKLIRVYHDNPLAANESEFKSLVHKSIDWKPVEEEDLFLMSFYAWIKSKMSQEPLYQTTLTLMLAQS